MPYVISKNYTLTRLSVALDGNPSPCTKNVTLTVYLLPTRHVKVVMTLMGETGNYLPICSVECISDIPTCVFVIICGTVGKL